MRGVYIVAYTQPKYGTYKCVMYHFKRKGIFFIFFFLLMKIKYRTVEVSKF